MREAIDSAIAQTYKNIEIIVVNDGSTDNTEEIAKSYGDKIRYYAKENGGVATALNLAIKNSKGEYVSWLSHDDVYYHKKIENQVNKLKSYSLKERKDVILWSNYCLINTDGKKSVVFSFQDLHEEKKLNTPFYPLFNGLIHGCTLLIPKSSFEKMGPFNESLKTTQDYDLWLQMFPTYNLVFMKDVLVKSREHENQNSKLLDGRKEELDELWMKMILAINDKQKVEMSGTEFDFYKNVYDYVKLSNRSLVAEKYLFSEIKNIVESGNFDRAIVTANLASFPVREASLETVIPTIIDQVDILNIYLNDYAKAPKFIIDHPRINYVLGEKCDGDLRDNGKFYFLNKVPRNSYYFTIDDDIVYPSNYVSKLRKTLKKYANQVVVGVHGIIFNKDYSNFTKSRVTFHFMKRLKCDIFVSTLGTGTVAFFLPTMKDLKLSYFKSVGMADLWLSAYCHNKGIKRLCINRNDEWLSPVKVKQDKNLWNESVLDSDPQNQIIINNKLWEVKGAFDNIKVSIIVPFHNKVDWLLSAIESVLEQDHENLELIIINDRSTDDIMRVENIADLNDRIILINNKHPRGAAGARNTGIDCASGDYIAFLDADDLFCPNKLSKQIKFMVNNNYYFSHTSYTLFSSDSEEKILSPGKIDYTFPDIIYSCTMATPTVMFDADLINEDSNKFPEKYLIGQDVCFWINMTRKATAYGLDEALSKVRKHDSNVAYDDKKQIQGINNIIDYVITNFLTEETYKAIEILTSKLSSKIDARYGLRQKQVENTRIGIIDKIKTENINLKKSAPKSFNIKARLRSKLKKMFWTVSPTFRMQVGNKYRLNDLVSKINHLNRSLDKKVESVDKKVENLKNNTNNNVESLIKSIDNLDRSVSNKVDCLEKQNALDVHIGRNRIADITVSLQNLTNVSPINSKVERDNNFISIICLIYRSTSFAKAVYESLYLYTPELRDGRAELLFVANDATDEVLDFLEKSTYNYVVNNNKVFSEKELFKMGYGTPEYIHRVYRGYNYGIKKCKGNIIVLINSDNMFSPHWLNNLFEKLEKNIVVCSQLVERRHPKFGVFPTAIHGEFGSHPDNYREEEFLSFAKDISWNKLKHGGAYMPCMSYKSNFEDVGYYPEGNIAGSKFEEIVQYGDENLYDKLLREGILHTTACNSIVYHFKEGERED